MELIVVLENWAHWFSDDVDVLLGVIYDDCDIPVYWSTFDDCVLKCATEPRFASCRPVLFDDYINS